jgi:DNA end-binding protein Ku
MAARANWRGYLKLSLVSCPVKLFTATTTTNRITFHMLHKDTHNRVQMKPHDPELGAVERSDLVKGYEFEKDRYVVVPEEELGEVQIESSKTISIVGFVDAPSVDSMYLGSPYFLAPDGPIAEETYRVIQSAMTQRKKSALGRVVLSGRERQVVIQTRGSGFTLTTLRHHNEVRSSTEAFEDITDAAPEPETLKLAEQIIDQYSSAFEPEKFEDQYQVALLALVKSKVKGEQPVIAKAPERGKVINLMDALKRTLEEGGGQKPPAKSKARQPTAGKKKTAESRRAGSARPRKKAAAG